MAKPAAAEQTKDNTLAVVAATLPGPHQAVLQSMPPFTGLVSAGLDRSGSFPLVRLVQKRAREQLGNIDLLQSLVIPCSRAGRLRGSLMPPRLRNFFLHFPATVVFSL